MSKDWPVQSMNPFLSHSSSSRSISTGKRGITPERTLENPLKTEINDHFNVELATTLAADTSLYKPLPLPDDMLGFDPIPPPNFNNTGMGTIQAFSYPSNNGMMNMDNASFNIENFLRTDSEENMGANDIDDNFLNDNLNLNLDGSKDADLEKVLLDLGISEAPIQDMNKQNMEDPPKRGHKRQLSGSEIFGFIGMGDNTQLSIGNMEPIQIIGKKPRYKEDEQFDTLEIFSNILDDPKSKMFENYDTGSELNQPNFQAPRTPVKFTTATSTTTQTLPSATNNVPSSNKTSKSDYYVPSGHPQAFKFPPSPPKGSFNANNGTRHLQNQMRESSSPNKDFESKLYSETQLQNQLNEVNRQALPELKSQSPTIRRFNELDSRYTKDNNAKYESPISTSLSSPEKGETRGKVEIPTPIPTSPLNSVAMSSPLKAKNVFQTPRSGSPRKFLFYNGGVQVSSKNKINVGNDTTITVDDKDKTISEMGTPIQDRSQILNNLQTPTKRKGMISLPLQTLQDKILGGSPRKGYANEDLKGPNRLGGRKKPTITSTLQSGTLDKYFIGPTHDRKFICKFYDKEIQGVCDREFGRISNVRAHIQTHLSDRPFVCEECDKAFVRNHDLKRHMKGHRGACNVCPCGKKFPRSDALKRHRLRNICVGGLIKEDGIEKPGYGYTYGISEQSTTSEGYQYQPVQDHASSLDRYNQSQAQTSVPSHAPVPMNAPFIISMPMASASTAPAQVPTQVSVPVPATATSTANGDLFDFNGGVSVGANGADEHYTFHMDDSLVM